ncbi:MULTISPECIES: DUF72 domain-containing protein [unclassified Lysobacter]
MSRQNHDDLFAATADAVNAIDGIRVGVGGWTYEPWRGSFYPAGLVQRRELEYASRQLSAIEINGTYYGTQKPETYARWASETPPGFVFSLKAPKRIMQSRVLASAGGQVEGFLADITALGDRLGPIVWQFDRGTQLAHDDFERFLDLLPPQVDGHPLRHVLDVRAPDFVDANYLAMVRSRGMATVFTDSREYPSFADVTADFVYLRLMRSQAGLSSGYSAEELALWARRARIWADGREPGDVPRIGPSAIATDKPRDVFVFFISAAKRRNPAAAMALIEQLRN